MSQVEGFLGGERDYRNLKGDTGPLVYPAGFLYIYSAFLYLTGGQVYPAQVIFILSFTHYISTILIFFSSFVMSLSFFHCRFCLEFCISLILQSFYISMSKLTW
jgi:hypothetical protein